MRKKHIEIKVIYVVLIIIFLLFFLRPLALLLIKSFQVNGEIKISNYEIVLRSKGFLKAVSNSFVVSTLSAVVTTIVAFLLAYTVHCTSVNNIWKKVINNVAVLPMLLPTITYGFAIIYSFGKQGLITKLLGREIFSIYGFSGLVLGYVIYTIPIAFLLISNTLKYIDKKFVIVSKLMGDKPLKTFFMTMVRPLIGTLFAAFIQSFFLSFTDYGIPAAIGGEYHVVASVLYNKMLGSVPDFNQGAVVAVIMLLPSILSILILKYLEKYDFRYNKISSVEIKKSKLKDVIFTIISFIYVAIIISIFAVIFIIPFVKEWPYKIEFTLSTIKKALFSSNLISIYANSLFVSLLTALFGTIIAYAGALVTARSNIGNKFKTVIDGVAMISNTIPGMVFGIALLFAFSGTNLQGTFFIIVICNILHFFATPYLMIKNSLSKMNKSWETTATLMGDSWIKTIARVVVPNSSATILEMFQYYFTNSMVTISAVIFIAGARTMVITTKIKELQHYAKFDEIFVLSLLILATNIIVKIITMLVSRRLKINSNNKKIINKNGGIR